MKLDEVRRILPQVKQELFSKPNVVAVGIGHKLVQGKSTETLSIICSVDIKKSKASLSSAEMVPAEIQGIPTDVHPTGVIRALQDPTGRFRPAPGGVSIGHVNITAGTLGCIVKKNNTLFILSNNHVLANSNDAQVGDPILQPGPFDGGSNPADHIANLSDFVPIEFAGGNGGSDPCGIAGAIAGFLNALAAGVGSKTRLYQRRIQTQQADNLVDCAIAQPINANDISTEILNIGQVAGVAEATLNTPLKKMGRTTGFTTDSVQQIDVTAQVNYGNNKIATFVDQILAGPMSQGGDSGSAVLNDQNQIVGLLFAGSQTTTIINRIQNVFSALNVTLP